MKARASPRRDVYSLLVNIRRNREAKERFTDSLRAANAHKARNINLTIYAVYSKIYYVNHILRNCISENAKKYARNYYFFDLYGVKIL